uniref:Leucine carboxyl methyltransferase 1 n=1 Tax=Ciona savignyi TaxID=51511 RepID=H2Z4V0_CIOSA
MSECSDVAIQATCDDASLCKRYAVQRGYWEDKYIGYMVQSSTSRKQPEISRGYYARTEAIWKLLVQFVSIMEQKCQIVSLGAGLDTTYWRLHEAGLVPHGYFEVDFIDVVTRKIRCIGTKPALRSCLSDFETQSDKSCLHCGAYRLVSADLRDILKLEDKLISAGIDFRLPTLFLAECVLIYMAPDKSSNLINWITDKFNDCVFINYEQINMDDSFAKVMINNLKLRNCWLAGAQACLSKQVQMNRFLDNGWLNVVCNDMWNIYNRLPDRQRIERLEMLDESELLEQLLQHYCLMVAVKDTSDLGLEMML